MYYKCTFSKLLKQANLLISMPFMTGLVCRLQDKKALTILENAPEGANVAPHLPVISLERRQDAERQTLDTLSQGLEMHVFILPKI